MTSIKPLGDRVVVKPKPADEKTESGLYIPESAKEKPQEGTVVAIGPGRVEDGTRIEMTVEEDDDVLYGKYAGRSPGCSRISSSPARFPRTSPTQSWCSRPGRPASSSR